MPMNLLMDSTQHHLMLALANAEGIVYREKTQHPSHQYHSAILHPQLASLLKEAGTSLANLDGIAVNIGPGSFTGIRTALNVARILGQFSPSSPKTYAFNAFELIAGHPKFCGNPVSILLDAFRDHVYQATLCVQHDGTVQWIGSPEVTANTALPEAFPNTVLLQASLESKLPSINFSFQTVESQNIFTPDTMAFFLGPHAETYARPWAELLPLYMQLPQISQKKSPAEGGSSKR